MSSTRKMDIYGDVDTTSPPFGIDLGTTNSCISTEREGDYPEIIDLGFGNTMPSCVEWLGGEEFVVGWEAYKNKMNSNVAYSVKRIIGSDKKVTLTYNGESRDFTPEEISAKVLEELVTIASKTYGKIKDVVITVPAYFNQNQIERTIKAGSLAGLNVLTTLSEPTSAALLFNSNMKENTSTRVLVYDFGGGTFDVSLLEIVKSSSNPEIDAIYGFTPLENNSTFFKVLAIDGDSNLGGDDIDSTMLELVLDKMRASGINTSTMSRVELETLRYQLEQYKKRNPVDLEVEILANGVMNKVMISKSLFISAVKPSYDKTKTIMNSALKGFDKSSIDQIILVGGTTKSPFIREFLRNDYPSIPINSGLNPDYSVSLGSAIEAKRKKFGNSKIQVFNALPISIGVLLNDYVDKVIYQNQVLPYSKTFVARTTVDNQESINVSIYQGNSRITEECVFLGDLLIDNIPLKPARELTFPITLSVNADGVLKCRVKVGGQDVEKSLINIFSGSDNQDTSAEELSPRAKKQVIRWSRVINKLDDSNKAIGMSLINRFKLGQVESTEIVKFLEDIR